MTDPTHEEEARVFGRYLLGREPSPVVVRLYVEASRKRPFEFMTNDGTLIRLVVGRPWLLRAVDCALAFPPRRSALRDKLLLMTAILETLPEHEALFLPQARPRGYWLVVALRLGGAAAQLLFGKVLLALL